MSTEEAYNTACFQEKVNKKENKKDKKRKEKTKSTTEEAADAEVYSILNGTECTVKFRVIGEEWVVCDDVTWDDFPREIKRDFPFI